MRMEAARGLYKKTSLSKGAGKGSSVVWRCWFADPKCNLTLYEKGDRPYSTYLDMKAPDDKSVTPLDMRRCHSHSRVPVSGPFSFSHTRTAAEHSSSDASSATPQS